MSRSSSMRVLVLDNYDSFTYNLVQYLGELGADVHAVRNDRATVDELLAERFARCVVSPGPCTPQTAGIALELVRRMPEAGVPTLGVCLGHQALAEAFGGRVCLAARSSVASPRRCGWGAITRSSWTPSCRLAWSDQRTATGC